MTSPAAARRNIHVRRHSREQKGKQVRRICANRTDDRNVGGYHTNAYAARKARGSSTFPTRNERFRWQELGSRPLQGIDPPSVPITQGGRKSIRVWDVCQCDGGHTHELEDETHDGVRVLNAGSVTGLGPADGRETMLTAEVTDGQIDVTIHET